MNIRAKVAVVPVPPVCSVMWTADDWARVTSLVDPAPRRECCGFVYAYDPVASKREGQIMYQQAGNKGVSSG